MLCSLGFKVLGFRGSGLGFGASDIRINQGFRAVRGNCLRCLVDFLKSYEGFLSCVGLGWFRSDRAENQTPHNSNTNLTNATKTLQVLNSEP